MIAASVKRGMSFSIFGLLVVALFIGSRTPLTFASTARTAVSRTDRRDLIGAERKRDFHWPGGPEPWNPINQGNNQANNQYLQGAHEKRTQIYVGSNQGNDGNQGINRGKNQDNSNNRGNQVINQRRNIGIQANNQNVLGGADGASNGSIYAGVNQGNSGNQGINQGNNQDNSGNQGSQVNNQGSVIGTQVNAPGSEVNNQGSVIHHQVEFIGLLPNLHLNLRLLPHPRLSLGLSGDSLLLPIGRSYTNVHYGPLLPVGRGCTHVHCGP